MIPLVIVFGLGAYAFHRRQSARHKMPSAIAVALPKDMQLADARYSESRLLEFTGEARSAPPESCEPSCDGPIVYRVSRSTLHAQGIEFPLGDPRPNLLYVGHPRSASLYYPAADFHRAVFEHKVSELHDLLACLGATRIVIEHECGWGREFGAKFSWPFGDSGGTISGDAKVGPKRTHKGKRRVTGLDRGCARPEVPPGLLWFNAEPHWKQVAEDVRRQNPKAPFETSWTMEYRDDFGVNANLKAAVGDLSIEFGGTFERFEYSRWNVVAEFPVRRRCRWF